MKEMNWMEISKEKNLTITFLKEHQSQLNWFDVNRHITLNKTFIQAFSKVLQWDVLVRNPSLTIELLEEIKDNPFVNWNVISMQYPVTKEMWDRLNTYIHMEYLLINPYKKVDIERTDKLIDGGRIASTYTVVEKKV